MADIFLVGLAGSVVFILGGALLSFGWSLGTWGFRSLFGAVADPTKVVIHNHPPLGHYMVGGPEGHAILRRREPEEVPHD